MVDLYLYEKIKIKENPPSGIFYQYIPTRRKNLEFSAFENVVVSRLNFPQFLNSLVDFLYEIKTQAGKYSFWRINPAWIQSLEVYLRKMGEKLTIPLL